MQAPEAPPGAVAVRDPQGRALGWALWSPASEISLRLLDSDPDARIGEGWWHARIASAIARRESLSAASTNAYRLVHGEGDALPSLVADRFDRWVVVQLLSAGLEAFRGEITEAIRSLTGAEGILARNDASVRAREGLARLVEPLWGDVPREVEVTEHGVRYIAAPHTGQKTGAFLDQRENRVLVGSIAKGNALDLFSYHGSFALHLARRAIEVAAVDSSADALERASENVALNGFRNVSLVQADAFEYLRLAASARSGIRLRYDTIVLDPRVREEQGLARGGRDLRGYRDVNLHADAAAP